MLKTGQKTKTKRYFDILCHTSETLSLFLLSRKAPIFSMHFPKDFFQFFNVFKIFYFIKNE